MVRAAALIGALLVTADAAHAQDAADGSRPDKTAGTALAEEALKAILKDPTSAQFAWPFDFTYGTFTLGSKSITGWTICGTINAKNSYGGYVGSRADVVVLKGGAPALALIDQDDRFPIIAKECSRLAMPVG